MLDFVRIECDSREWKSLVAGAVERQKQYLGRLAVLQRYRHVGEHLHTDVYALASLWRSLEELAGTDLLTETYIASLAKLGRAETEGVAHAYSAVADFFLQTVSIFWHTAPVQCRGSLQRRLCGIKALHCRFRAEVIGDFTRFPQDALATPRSEPRDDATGTRFDT